MPSPKKPGHKALLVQVPDDVHTAADRRRRVENVTWPRLIAELLRRWVSGDQPALDAPVRCVRPAGPDSDEAARLHEKWKREDPAYARAATERVDITTLPRYRSFGELLAADAAKAGRTIPANVAAELEDDDDV